MDDEVSNDNVAAAATPQREPDPHGHAAILLVESLIHGLIARSLISVAEAVEIVEIASESSAQIAEENGSSPDSGSKSVALLDSISASLKLDIPTN